MPEQELRDLDVRNNDIRVDERGDLALVDGIDNVKQSAALDVRDITAFEIGSVLTSNTVHKLQSTIERSLQQDPQLASPTVVTIDSVDTQAGIVTFHVETRDDEDFTLDIIATE